MKSETGFSLTELLVVLALVAMVAGFAVPTVSTSMRSWQLASDARNIASTLTYAKISSMSQMTHFQLSFNLGANQWSVSKYNRGTAAYEVEGSTNGLAHGLANNGITFRSTSSSAPSGFGTSSSTSITFNSRGIPVDATGRPTANNVVYISDASDNYAITVSLSGRVQLWRCINDQWGAQ